MIRILLLSLMLPSVAFADDPDPCWKVCRLPNQCAQSPFEHSKPSAFCVQWERACNRCHELHRPKAEIAIDTNPCAVACRIPPGCRPSAGTGDSAPCRAADRACEECTKRHRAKFADNNAPPPHDPPRACNPDVECRTECGSVQAECHSDEKGAAKRCRDAAAECNRCRAGACKGAAQMALLDDAMPLACNAAQRCAAALRDKVVECSSKKEDRAQRCKLASDAYRECLLHGCENHERHDNPQPIDPDPRTAPGPKGDDARCDAGDDNACKRVAKKRPRVTTNDYPPEPKHPPHTKPSPRPGSKGGSGRPPGDPGPVGVAA